MAAAAACLLVALAAGCSGSTGLGGRGGSAGTPASGMGGTTTIPSGMAGSAGGASGSNQSGSSGGALGSAGAGGAAGAAGATGSGGAAGRGAGMESNGGAGSNGGTGAGGAAGQSGDGGSSGGAGAGGGASSSGGTGPAGTSGTAGSAGNAGGRGNGGAAGVAGGGGGSTGGAGGRGSSSSCPPSAPMTGGTRYCSNSKGNAGGNYKYELWSNGQGSGCMTVYGVGANFSATWTTVTDFLARAGLQFDRTKTPAQIGTISANFSETKTEVPTDGRTSKIYVAVYGWTVSPLAEYYVIEDYGDFVPGPVTSAGEPRTHMGTITVDGGVYDVWQIHVTNKPAITGDNQDFDQYFSVRQTRRQCGHVSVSQHFSKWTDLGLKLGKLEEAMFLMEAQGNSGTIDISSATIVVQ